MVCFQAGSTLQNFTNAEFWENSSLYEPAPHSRSYVLNFMLGYKIRWVNVKFSGQAARLSVMIAIFFNLNVVLENFQRLKLSVLLNLKSKIGRRFGAALLPRLLVRNPRSHHKGTTARVRTGNQLLPVLYHCQLGQDIPILVFHLIFANIAKMIWIGICSISLAG